MASASLPSSLFLTRADSLVTWYTVAIVLLIVFLARAINVWACAALIYRIRGLRMRLSHKIVIWYSGLRGAMSTLSSHQPSLSVSKP